MVGAIRRRDILAHPLITIHCFGWKVFVRALLAGKNETFLSLLTRTPALRAASEYVPALVDRCIALELRAARIYESLARRFDEAHSSKRFFTTLARQEHAHAELLELCRAAVARGQWHAERFDPLRDAVPHLEEQMRDAEAQVGSLACLSDAVRLVIRLESSEINQVYSGIVAASGSDFVRKLRGFHDAMSKHVSYISTCIPKMEPELRSACHKLRDEYCGDLGRA